MARVDLEQLLGAVDRKDVDAFVSFLAEDAVFRYGSQDPVRGKAAIRDSVAMFLGMIPAISHRLIDTWERDDTLVCQGEVTYTLLDGREVTIPFVNVFRLDGELIRDYLVYVDPTPLAG